MVLRLFLDENHKPIAFMGEEILLSAKMASYPEKIADSALRKFYKEDLHNFTDDELHYMAVYAALCTAVAKRRGIEI